LGYTPIISDTLRSAGLLVPIFIAGLILIVAAVVAAALKLRVGTWEVAVLLGTGAAYALVFVRMELPEERTHILEYVLVALFVFEALNERSRNLGKPRAGAVMAVVIAASFGAIDEALQAALPNRVFDLRDIAFNTLAAVMAVAARTALGWARSKAASRKDKPPAEE
jgi:flagellar basal body-associated protein FliL